MYWFNGQLARAVLLLLAVGAVTLGAFNVLAHERHKHAATSTYAAEGEVPASVDQPEPPRSEREAHREASGVPKPLAWLGKLHPSTVHFPIALLIAAAIAELLAMERKDSTSFHIVRFCVWLGALTAIAAAPLGWFFAGFHVVDDDWVMTTHRWLGTGTAAWAGLTLVFCERAYRDGATRRAFRFALFVGATLVGLSGFFGGSLIYGIDHFAW